MYTTACLEQAVANAAAAREERLKQQARPVELDDSYRRLFARMGAVAPEQARGLGFCLEPKEKALLCEYLFTEAADSEKETLSYALLEELDKSSVVPIYKQCLNKYDDPNFKPMFKRLRASKSFTEALSEAFDFRAETVLEALNQGTIVDYINSEAGDRAAETEGGYIGALRSFGIDETMPLYRKCAELYVVVCDAKEYRRLGVDSLMSMTREFEVDHKTRLLRNMLNVMDDFQLQTFVPMIEEFVEITGDKGSGQYKEALGGLSSANLDKYELWTSKYKIRKVLGDGEISKFWYDYAGRAGVSELEGLNTLLFDFGSFMVFEIADNEAAYFYDTKYYRNTVMQGLGQVHSGAELEEWLREKTQWSASGEHQSHWRKAHRGQWQLAFREYIGTNGQ